MKRLSLASGFELTGKRTRKHAFLEEVDQVLPRAELIRLFDPHYWGKASTGRPPFACGVMLRIHCLQQWFGLSDPARWKKPCTMFRCIASLRAWMRASSGSWTSR